MNKDTQAVPMRIRAVDDRAFSINVLDIALANTIPNKGINKHRYILYTVDIITYIESINCLPFYKGDII